MKKCQNCGKRTMTMTSATANTRAKIITTPRKCEKWTPRTPNPRLPHNGRLLFLAVSPGYQDLTTAGSFEQTLINAIDYGYNLLVLAFWLDPGHGADPSSAASRWSQLPPAQQADIMLYAHSNGAKIIVSAGGSTFTDYQVTGPNSGTGFGSGAANFAKTHQLDGVDFDMENFVSPNFTTPSLLTKSQSIQWLTDATSSARAILGETALITHAPQSPYFSTPEFAQGYLDFYLQTPTPSVDLFLIQYYNQGATYLTYDSQLVNNDNFTRAPPLSNSLIVAYPKGK